MIKKIHKFLKYLDDPDFYNFVFLYIKKIIKYITIFFNISNSFINLY